MRYFDNFIYFSNKFLHLFCSEKRGGLWIVRYSLYQGGNRLTFASDKFLVCGQEFMLYRVADMICVSMVVVGDIMRPLSG